MPPSATISLWHLPPRAIRLSFATVSLVGEDLRVLLTRVSYRASLEPPAVTTSTTRTTYTVRVVALYRFRFVPHTAPLAGAQASQLQSKPYCALSHA